MANKIKAKLALQLAEAGLSANRIEQVHRISKKSQKEVREAAAALGITYADVADLSDDEVYRRLFPDRNNHASVFVEPDWEKVHRELARVGVTLQLLHEEYRDRCTASGGIAMGYDRFCREYRSYTLANNVTSRVGHKAGRICEVDWSGPKMQLVDPDTGEIIPVYLFVACLPFSRYTYVEPTLDMKEGTWLLCHVHMFEFFGGSTPMIVPDNLKTGIASHPAEGEVVLNDAYREMAAHYSAAVIPARVRSPKDKPSAEGAVGNIATAIIARLRTQVFTDFDMLRFEVSRKLREYNDAPFQKREDASRSSCFFADEKPLLRPLPATPYEVCRWIYGRKVQMNCHVSYMRNFYSVNWAYVGKTVDLRVTDTTLEIYLGAERLATHKLFGEHVRNRYSTNEADLPRDKAYSDWDAERIRRWARRIGPSAEEVVDRIFASVRFEEQGYNPSLAILRLSHRYGAERLERACAIAIKTGIRSPRYSHIEPVLKTNQDKMDESVVPDSPGDEDTGGYVRGAGYYGGE